MYEHGRFTSDIPMDIYKHRCLCQGQPLKQYAKVPRAGHNSWTSEENPIVNIQIQLEPAKGF